MDGGSTSAQRRIAPPGLLGAAEQFEARARLAGDMASVLAKVWAALTERLEDAPATVPDGLFELDRGAGRLQAITSRKDGLFAARLIRDLHYSRERIEISVATLKKKTVATCVAWLESTCGTRLMAPRQTPDVWNAIAKAGAVDSPGSIPSFDELRQIYLRHCGTQLTTTSAIAPRPTTSDGGSSEELDYYRTLAQELRSAVRQQNRRLAELQAPTSEEPLSSAGPSDRPIAPLLRLADITAWAMQLEHELEILPRALQETRKSPYSEPESLGEALCLLGGPYRRMRLGELSQAQFNEALTSSGFRLSRSAGETTIGQQDEYKVRWGGRVLPLDWHLAKGASRDPRYCLRIYFLFDEEAGIPVVGWMPSHLPNSLT